MVECTEANIVINGVRLNFAQSMTLRVGIGSFAGEMSQLNALGEFGEEIQKLYYARAREIEQIIFKAFGDKIHE